MSGYMYIAGLLITQLRSYLFRRGTFIWREDGIFLLGTTMFV